MSSAGGAPHDLSVAVRSEHEISGNLAVIRGAGVVQRWRYGAAAVLVLIAATVGWWLLARDSDGSGGRVDVSLVRVDTDPYSPTYSYPEWWTDGSTALRFGSGASGLWVAPASSLDGRKTEAVALAADQDLFPAALAATPGGSAWVAVALDKGGDDDPVRVRSWGATESAEDDEPRSAVEVPVDLDPASSSENIITMDVAVAEVDQDAVAVLAIHQADRTVALASRPGAGWQQIELPGGPATTVVMSAGSGIVALTDAGRGSKQLWFADVKGLDDDFADLSWTEVKGVPQDVDFQVGRDGADAATIVWRGGSPRAVQVQVVRPKEDGTSAELETVVEPASWRSQHWSINTVLKSGGQWYLAGSVPSKADINLAYGASAPAVWLLVDDSWRRVDDRLLANQPDQRFDLLWKDPDERVLGASSSPPLDIAMVWRLDTAD